MTVLFYRKKAGFTIVEIIIVVAIFSVIAGITFAGVSKYGKRMQFEQFTAEVSTLVNETRQRAVVAQDGSSWGIYVSPTSIEAFSGSSVVPGDPANNIVTVPNYVIATSTFYSNTGSVVFAERTGLPNATGTVFLVDNRTVSTSTIKIEAGGLIE